MDPKPKSKINFWGTIYSYVKDYKKNITAAVVFSMFTGVMVSIQPFIIKFIVDNGILNESLASNQKVMAAGFYCLIYVVISASRVLLWKFGVKNQLKTLEGMMFNIRANVFDHVQHMCMKFYDKNSAGELYNCIMGSPVSTLKNFINQIIMGVPYQFVSLIISVSAMLYYDWVLTIVLISTAFLMVIFNRLSRPKILNISKEYIKAETEASRYITDMFHGMDAVKLYSVEDNIFEKFRFYIGDMKDKAIRVSYSQTSEQIKPEFVQYLGTAVIYFVGAVSCVYRGMSTGVLFAFLSSMGIILGTLSSWLSLALQRSSAEAGLVKIYEVLESDSTTPELPKNEQENVENKKNKAIKENLPVISFENVRFGYDDKEIFYNLSCQIKYNESVAIVGNSGGGKSTFTKLVMRLYDVEDGCIKIHGCNIKKYPIHDFRYCFGVVPQNPFIFRGSIWDNIKLARPDASDADIKKAMEISHVNEFVNELQNGCHTMIGDGYMDLSGGQKQRIAIARAVLGNPDILIFDEATSALDNISEKHIQKAIDELMEKHTVIIVAHRLSTVRNVDRIMVFNDGEIAEQGTYDELLKKDGEFKKLLTFGNY